VAATDDDLLRLEARNAAMKNQLDDMLEQLDEQTKQFKDMQTEIAQISVTVKSADGLVGAKIDASGTLTDLRIAPSAFTRTTPENLARSVREAVRKGTIEVKQRVAELTAPLAKDMPDLSDLFEGAPSLAGLMPDLSNFLPKEEAPSNADSFEEEGSILQSSLDNPVAKVTVTEPMTLKTKSTSQTSDDEPEEPPTSWLTRKGS